MPPRKGKGRQAVRHSSGGVPGWAWAIGGLAAGALLVLVLTHKSMLPVAPDTPQPNAQATAERGGENGIEPTPASTAPKKPQYDFYSVLSEKEVRIPDEQISAQARAEQQQKQAALGKAQSAATPPPTRPVPPPAPANAPSAVSQDIAAAPVAAPPPPAASSGYLLQVGAFPSANDAESLKARLALQGFVANVQSVNVGGQTYHRVRLGPFRSASDLESTKQRLSGAGIRAIALKEGR